jgi:hypothetical protein
LLQLVELVLLEIRIAMMYPLTAMNEMSDMFALAYAKRMSGHSKDKKQKMNVITT